DWSSDVCSSDLFIGFNLMGFISLFKLVFFCLNGLFFFFLLVQGFFFICIFFKPFIQCYPLMILFMHLIMCFKCLIILLIIYFNLFFKIVYILLQGIQYLHWIIKFLLQYLEHFTTIERINNVMNIM